MFAHKPFASGQNIDLKGSAGFEFRELRGIIGKPKPGREFSPAPLTRKDP